VLRVMVLYGSLLIPSSCLVGFGESVGVGREYSFLAAQLSVFGVSSWIHEESNLQELCRILFRRDVRSAKENSLVMSAMMRRSTPAQVCHPTSVELTDRAISKRVSRVLGKAPNFIQNTTL
jgi:hypothetical protein